MAAEFIADSVWGSGADGVDLAAGDCFWGWIADGVDLAAGDCVWGFGADGVLAAEFIGDDGAEGCG